MSFLNLIHEKLNQAANELADQLAAEIRATIEERGHTFKSEGEYKVFFIERCTTIHFPDYKAIKLDDEIIFSWDTPVTVHAQDYEIKAFIFYKR